MSKTEVSRVNVKERAVVDLAIHTSEMREMGTGKLRLVEPGVYAGGMP